MPNPFIPTPHPDDHPDLAEHRALLRRAPRLAFYYARLAATGGLSRPSSDAPPAMRIGWMLAIRGYEAAPIWLKYEWSEASRQSWARAGRRAEG